MDCLEQVLKPRERVAVAFSGGVDSTVVAVAARRVLGKTNAPSVVGDSPSLPRREMREVQALAKAMDLELVVVQPDEQEDPGYQANAGNRCYFCKSHLYQSMHAWTLSQGIGYLANGTNTDDLGDHRPGLQAAKEAQVISPLLEARMDKAAVREAARAMGLPNADKPAAACLASRVPFGVEVTPAVLAQIEEAEEALYALGFIGFRVRHEERLARVEMPWDQVDRLMEESMRQAVVDGLKRAGYAFVTLDLEGFRSGSGNVMLTMNGRSTMRG